MKRSSIYLAAIWITFFPRIVVPLLLVALLGWLVSFCSGQSPCPTDPVSHLPICSSTSTGDPWALQRALESQSGVRKTPAQWQAEANSQAEVSRCFAAAEARQAVIDDHQLTIRAAAQMRSYGYYKAARKMLADQKAEEQHAPAATC